MKKTLKIFVLILVAMLTSACNLSTAKETETSTEEIVEVIPSSEVSISENTLVKGKVEIVPIEATVSCYSDYEKLEPLAVGKYQIKDTNILMNIYDDHGVVVGHLADGVKSEYLKSPRVITTDGCNYIYGEGFNRQLNRIEYTEKGLKMLEESVIWTDLPEGVNRCTKGFLANGALGETKTENGKWKYAIYVGEEEKASVIADVKLNFNFDDGLAISDDGEVYLIYYSSEPYTMEMVKVEMPEKCNPDEFFYIDSAWGLDYSNFGFSLVCGISGKEYLIITRNKDVLARNGFEDGRLGLKPLDYIPAEYEIIEIKPQNFEKFEILWGSDAGAFFLRCSIELDENYSYFYDEYYLEITQNYLSNFIPDEELEASYGMCVNSYDEALDILEKMKEELPRYEAEHVDEIKVYLQKYSYLLEEEESGAKEFSEKYGI